jgi:hypothetical protein
VSPVIRKTISLVLGLGLILAVVCPAVAAKPAATPEITDRFLIQVVDGNGLPVPGATVTITPIWGRAEGPLTSRSDSQGMVDVEWRPRVSDRFVGLKTDDIQKFYLSQFSYRVQAAGFLPAGGTATLRDVYNYFHRPVLRIMNRLPVNKTLNVIVTIHRAAEYLGPLTQGKIVSQRLIQFLEAYAPRLSTYGLYFNVPAFRLISRGGAGVLVIRVRRLAGVRSLRVRLFPAGVSTGRMRPNFGLDGEVLGNLLFLAADPLITRLAGLLDSPQIGVYGVRVAIHVYDPDRPFTAARPVSLGFFITAANLARRRDTSPNRAGIIKLYSYYWDQLPILTARVIVPGSDPVVRHSWWGRGPEVPKVKKKAATPRERKR